MILSNSVLKKNTNYYLQVILKDCKYIIKERKIKINIKDNLNISSDEETSDKESFDVQIAFTLLVLSSF